MRNSYFVCLSILLTGIPSVHSQGLLDGLNQFKKAIESVKLPAAVDAPANDDVSRGTDSTRPQQPVSTGEVQQTPNVPVQLPERGKQSIEETICSRIKESAEIKALMKAVKDFDDQYPDLFKINNDTKDLILEKTSRNLLVEKKLNGGAQELLFYHIERCIDSLVESDLVYVFFKDHNSRIDRIVSARRRNSPEKSSTRGVDSKGNIVMKEVDATVPRQHQINRPVKFEPSRHAMPIILTIGGEQFAANIFKNAFPEIIAEINSKRGESETLAKRRKESELEDKKRAEQDKEKAIQLREELAKPENLLAREYATYIVLKTCHDVRKGYQAVYFSDEQFKEFTRMIRRIENDYKAELKELTTDEVWQRTVKSERVDIATYSIKNQTDFSKGSRECNQAASLFNYRFNGKYGAQPIKKDF